MGPILIDLSRHHAATSHLLLRSWFLRRAAALALMQLSIALVQPRGALTATCVCRAIANYFYERLQAARPRSQTLSAAALCCDAVSHGRERAPVTLASPVSSQRPPLPRLSPSCRSIPTAAHPAHDLGLYRVPLHGLTSLTQRCQNGGARWVS